MKNKIVATMIIAVFAFSLTGCNDMTNSISTYPRESIVGETEVEGQLKCVSGDNVCSEWVDEKTGVHYYYTHVGGLELRVNADGTPYTD